MTLGIVDITRANPGTERKVVDSVLSARGEEFTVRPVVVGFAHQESQLSGSSGMTEYRSVGDWLAEGGINQFIAGVLREKVPADVEKAVVYSYHAGIIQKTGALAECGDLTFETASPTSLVRASQTVQAPVWPVELMPLDDAVRILAATLRENHVVESSPVLKTRVRELLKQHDGRFDKKHSPAAGAPNLMTVLLTEAESRGVVRQSGQEPRVLVWLGGDTAGGQPTAQAAGVTPDATTLADKLDEQVAAIMADPETTRSTKFQLVLKTARFGPFPEVRQVFYDSMREVAENHAGPEPLTARELSQRAVSMTYDATPDPIPRPESSKNGPLPRDRYAWKGLEEFGVEALYRTRMLKLSEDMQARRIPWVISRAEVVTPFPSDFDVRLDAEMIRELLRRGVEVTWEDRVEVSGAILNGRDDELFERVVTMMTILFDDRKVSWDEDRGCLVLVE